MFDLHNNIKFLSLTALFGIACSLSGVQALPLESYASTSRLSSGKWVKISVKEDGMQFVSNETLKSMGFSNPEQVHVYGYGGRRLPQTLDASTVFDLPLQLSVYNGDGLVFFGTGTVNRTLRGSQVIHEQNPYSTESCYFLSDVPLSETDNLPAPLKTPYGSDDKRIDTFTEYLLHEKEISAAGDTGSDLFGEDFRTTSTHTFTFDLPGAVTDEVQYKVCFAAKAGIGSNLTFSSDGKELGTMFLSGSTDSGNHVNVGVSTVQSKVSDSGKGNLTIKYAGSGVVYKAFLDYIECSYQRALTLGNEPLIFYYNVEVNEHPVFTVSGITDNTQVWDVTDPVRPVEVSYTKTDGKACFAPAADGLRRYVVFNPRSVSFTPVSAGNVANQDIHSMETPQMLIISPKEYLLQAERVADLHRRKDGMTVHVLTPEVIYNEFSSGTPDVSAYRKLMKMWYDRSQDKEESSRFGYCLLFGRATYDQRKLTDNLRSSAYPRVLTWESTLDLSGSRASLTETNSYVSDNYIAMLEDCGTFVISQSQLSVGVGRMPVKSLSEARAMVDKLIKFVEQPDLGSKRTNVLILADDGDNAVHAEQSNNMYSRMIRNGGEHYQYERMFIDAYEYGSGSYKKTYPQAKSRMMRLLEEGVGLWTYIGHANPTSLTAEDMWTYTDLTSMTNKFFPVFYTASCEFIRFDADAVSGCETMWLHPQSGIIAAIAANRKVFISNNGYLSLAFGENYFKRDSHNLPRRLGDIYKSSINNVGKDDNRHRYALMGDPAMRAPLPEYEVKVETIGDVVIEEADDAVDTAGYPVISGLSKVKVSGSILTAEGELATDFNGTVVPTLYDAETVITTNGHNTNADSSTPDGKPISYNDRKSRLFSGNFPVVNGKWEATLLVPEEIENNYTQGRLTVYACREGENDSRSDAAGSTDKFYVYGWDESAIIDNTPPEIVYMYLNNSAFRNGATVAPNPVFKTKVRDESGINISTAGVGRLLTVTVDGIKVYDNLNDYFTTDPGDPTAGTIAYPLTGLGEGEHELSFLAWDNAGNSSRATLNFKIAPSGSIPDLDIYTDASPAISSVTFYINSPEAVMGLVEVFDLSGSRVWYSDASQGDGAFSTRWNLMDKGGSRVPRGIYLYRATIRDAAGNETRATKKFAVGNP